MTKMNNTAWKAARERAADAWEKQHGEPAPAALRKVRVRDLKRTFGRRLDSGSLDQLRAFLQQPTIATQIEPDRLSAL